MKKLTLIALFLSAWAGIAQAQSVVSGGFKKVNTLPPSCTTNVSNPVQYQGKVYQCIGGVYAVTSTIGSGGVANATTTTIGADTDANGSGTIDLQTRNVTRLQVANDGTVVLSAATANTGSALQVATKGYSDLMAGRNTALKFKGVLVHVGDSNTNGRPAWRQAYEADWLAPGGIFQGWTSYNIGQNGTTLADWATTEITNADNPLYSSLAPQDYTNVQNPGAGRLARVINAKPDVIILSLGTNDLNNPGSRASIGTEANLRTNLAALVNFLLARTTATIVLRMPQPFAYEDFSGVTQWVNAAEAAEASRRLRQVYREWTGRHSRVEVYDSHAALFGDSCDNKAVNAQDPWLASTPLIDDSLHFSWVAAIRMCSQIDSQLRGGINRSLVAPKTNPDDVVRFATWATTLYTHQTAGVTTSGSYVFSAGPDAVVANQRIGNFDNILARIGPLERLKQLVEITPTASLVGLQELLNIPLQNLLFAYNHTSGTTVQITSVTLAGWQSNGTRQEPLLTITGPALAGLGGGRVTFYTTDPKNLPYTYGQNYFTTNMATTQQIVALPVNYKIKSAKAYRINAIGTPVITLYVGNQPNGAWNDGVDNLPSGKPVGTFTFTQYSSSPASLVFNATYYPSGVFTNSAGSYLYLKITTGAIGTEFLGGASVIFSDI